MSPYKELLARCALASVNAVASTPEAGDADVIVLGTAAVLAEILRTLETVTPEMGLQGEAEVGDDQDADACWLSMLRASPLAPS